MSPRFEESARLLSKGLRWHLHIATHWHMPFDVPRTHQTGRLGALRVMAALEELGIGVEGIREHDFGMDVFLHTRNAALVDLGLFATAQIKSGTSYFQKPVRVDGEVRGWWFTADEKDLDYWQQNALPHLIVLHDPESRESFWRRVSPDAVERTGGRWRILVLSGQRIDDTNRDDLLRDLTARAPSPGLEGTAWVEPALRDSGGVSWRLALCAPRLVAPHRNTGFPEPIGPMAAAALLVQHRLRDYEAFAEAHPAVPGWAEAGSHARWEWRFVHALGRWLVESDPEPLMAAVPAAQSPSRLAAALVAASVATRSDRGAAHALAILEAHVPGARFGPHDRAWVAVHTARLALERGDSERATREAKQATATLALDTHPMATALRGAAAAVAWSSSDWSVDAVEEVVRGADNHFAWWRSQALASAGEELLHRNLEQWSGARDRTTMEDQTLLGLVSAVRASAFLAGHPKAAFPTARYRLMDADTAEEAAWALDAAILAGDDRAVRLAVRRYAESPLLSGVRKAGELRRDAWWDRSSFHATATFAQEGGDLLGGPSAEALINDNLEIAFGEYSLNRLSAPLGTSVGHYVLRGAAALLPAVAPEAQRSVMLRVADALARRPSERPGDELDRQALLDAFDWSVIPSRLVEAAAAAVRDSPVLTKTVRAAAASGGHRASRHLIDRAAADGDVLTLQAAAWRGVIPAPEPARRAMSAVAEWLRDGPDSGDAAARPDNALLLLLWLAVAAKTPDADWKLIASTLGSSEYRGRRRAQATAYLLNSFDRVPSDAWPALASALSSSEAAPSLSDRRVHVGDVAAALALGGRLGTEDPRNLRRQAQEWLLSGDTSLVHAAGVLCLHAPAGWRIDRSAVAAAALNGDDPQTAALGVALAVRRPITVPVDVLIRAAEQRGRAFSLALAHGLRGQRSSAARAALRGLADHPSAAVRAVARPPGRR